ncbi:unnamed protein product [Caenorhabditis angaria]|uniref:Uncharacterized protein n=1 Tax=Caenorhabditis angaria TaxID=860376 RepID=A0A9P1IBB9_9PELO|nr:unnamed protein product [Caenorhabditis angaria]
MYLSIFLNAYLPNPETLNLTTLEKISPVKK